MGLASELESSLREFAAATSVEIRENDARPIPFSSVSWEIRGAAEKPLLHLWSENYNVTRRVLAITHHSDQRLALAVERFGRTKPERLEFIRVEFERSARELTREEFAARLGRILAEQFPDEKLESVSVSQDLEHSLSGNYVRGILRRHALTWALLAVPEGESADTIDNTLTFGLLWLERARETARGSNICGLKLILPKRRGRTVAHRARALRPEPALQVFELDAAAETLEEVTPAAGNVDTRLVPHRETEMLLERARPALEQIIGRSSESFTLRPAVRSREVWLQFRGLAIARWEDGQVFFGITDAREQLTPSSRPRLERLLQELERYRNPLATDRRHPLYRAQPERWLEDNIRRDITVIDAALDSHFVYSQVFAKSGANEHGIVDLLGVTRRGRLAILELKASEHIHLPLQAAEYWLRIRRHLEEEDFLRAGYFPGLELQKAPPLVYLVAPALRFHPTTDSLLHYLLPEIEVTRVGLTEGWRRGICVVMRQ